MQLKDGEQWAYHCDSCKRRIWGRALVIRKEGGGFYHYHETCTTVMHVLDTKPPSYEVHQQ